MESRIGEQKFTDIEAAAALTTTRGNMTTAAEILGVTRQAVSHRVKNVPELREIVTDLSEGRLDRAESSLDKAAEAGEPWAVCFLLKTQGRTRGYIERNEIAILMSHLAELEQALQQGTAGHDRGIATGPGANPPALLEAGDTVTDGHDL